MKVFITVSFLLLTCLLVNGQTQTKDKNTQSLLSWIIKKEHIRYLNAKSNAAIFYDKNAFTLQTLIADSGKTVPNKSLKDFLPTTELDIGKRVPPMLEQTDWRIKYAHLKAKFVTDKFITNMKAGQTVYAFSEPIFLNEQKTKALIGEYFTCGVACGRDDLLPCEFKNGHWQLIVRAVVAND
jgi:hypothetical protein